MDERFIDEDDWLKGFTLLVRNNSNKTVTHIGLRMVFPATDERTEYPALWLLGYGPDPFFYNTDAAVPKSDVPSVLPRDEIELKLSNAELEDLRTFLKKIGFPNPVHVVEIGVNSIGFADGTAWYGRMLKRGSDGIKWKPVGRPGGVQNNHVWRPKFSRQSRNAELFFPASSRRRLNC